MIHTVDFTAGLRPHRHNLTDWVKIIKTTTYLINSWRALKDRFQNPVGAISESRPVGNRRSLLQRESTHNEPTNPIYEIRSK